MKIYISDAHENNLKHISFNIMHNQITALTGVSGSGKSTILRNILSATGAKNYARSKSKTIKDGMNIVDIVNVANIENLPQTILIDVINHVNTPTSTLATISGIHGYLRSIFYNHATHYCLNCGHTINTDIYSSPECIEYLVADLIYDVSFNEKLDYLKANYDVSSIYFYDKNGSTTASARSRAFSTVLFKVQKLTNNVLKNLNQRMGNKVKIKIHNIADSFNPLLYTICLSCNQLSPILSKSRFSFNIPFSDGGGACTHCNGTGRRISIAPQSIIMDGSKSIFNNSMAFVSESGIKYTTITGLFIRAFLKKHNIDVNLPINELPSLQLNLLLFGSDEIIHFHDTKGGKKSLRFSGLINYLLEIYYKGQRKDILTPFINECECSHCLGTRIDPIIDAFKVDDHTVRDILLLTISELKDWCSGNEKKISGLRILSSRLNNFVDVSCGHLALNRSSPGISGGEMQRIKLCAMLNSDIRNICYLLDEPSSGLHYNDLAQLMSVLERLKKLGNTIVLVEHNNRILEQCDNIIDIGPGAGDDGGEILFHAKYSDISNYSTLTSTSLLNKENHILIDNHSNTTKCDTYYFSLENINENNLKNISASIPYEKITTICGVSGSGKTTLLDKVIFERISRNMHLFDFKKIVYIKQKGFQRNSSSNIATILGISDYLAKAFARKNQVDHKIFSSGSAKGKCIYCQGKGKILTKEGEEAGVCIHCSGKRFDQDTLNYKYDDIDIHTYLSYPMSILLNLTKDVKVVNICQAAIQLGVGYLSFSRNSTTLSKGEFQRVLLINVLSQKESHTLCLLDEPVKGLHNNDIAKLKIALREIIHNGNTIIAVEHNLEFINDSDHIIEIGPRAGKDGGYLMFSGPSSQFNGTITSAAIAQSKKPFYKVEETSLTDIQNYTLSVAKNFVIIKKNEISTVSDKSGLMNDAYHLVEDIFLRASIHNYANYNSVYSEKEISANIPLMICIDFNADKQRYFLSIGEILGVNEYITHGFMSSHPQSSPILRHVTNPQSPTGKCFKCSGKGEILSLPRDIFIKSGALSKDCLTFLRNSTKFKEISKYYLNKFDINWAGDISQLNSTELSFLFDGFSESIIINDQLISWNGIIENAIQHYKYYPDATASQYINKNKRTIPCPVCNSDLLQNEFKNIQYNNFSYSEWMNTPISKLYQALSSSHHNDLFCRKISKIIELLIRLTDDNICFGKGMNEFNAKVRGIILLTSHFYNNIHGACILIKNIDTLSTEQREIIGSLFQEWKMTNTIILCNDKCNTDLY